MADKSGMELTAQLEARKEIDYYKSLATETGNIRLRETEELSSLIGELRKTKQDLEQERRRFQILAEQAPYAMAVISSDGRFLYVNPNFIEMFGYDLSDVPNGREWFRKAYPDTDYRHEVISTWIKHVKGRAPGETTPKVFLVTCKDGTEKVIHFRPVKLNSDEDMMTCEDITDRRRAEEALRQSEETVSYTHLTLPTNREV